MPLEILYPANHLIRLKDLEHQYETRHELPNSSRTLLAIRNAGVLVLLVVESQEIAVVCYEHPTGGT